MWDYFCRVSSRWWSMGSIETNVIAAQRDARFFFNHMPEDAGGKHVKVKKRQRQNTMRQREN